MADHVVLLSIPGLREQDLEHMPNLSAVMQGGDCAPLVPSFPAVTWPVQTNLLTGQLPVDHGVVANGFYWRDRNEVEMWTAGNKVIEQPQIWDILKKHNPSLTSAAWFPMLSKECNADYVCMPKPVHNPDGSESLWCYTHPIEYYGELRDELDHFPLKHFWGPLANIKSSAWIADSAVMAAKKHQPNFFYIYITHLDYAAQKSGPDSEAALVAVKELDELLGRFFTGMKEAYQDKNVLYLAASEYTIVPVDHVVYPNRVLREAGLLAIDTRDDGEHLDYQNSQAWALADHQFSHVYIKDANPDVIQKVKQLFTGVEGIAEVLALDERKKYQMDHERSGEVILISTANSWQAYYWWLDDANAPGYARTVDIHQKPGYDPVELHFDMQNKCIPLDATLIGGSHGAPALEPFQRGILLGSERGAFLETPLADTDVCDLVLKQFGV
ncbi:MAG: alkaline phosphatase family protein [Blastopirellula sp.]|nr:MAG: alkaline phosphatase family protein [Blastopirellula sp.]